MKVTVTHGTETVVIEDTDAGVASTLIKSEAARQYTLSVAYFADKPDIGKAADGYRDFAPAPVVQEAAWEFMKTREVGTWHADGTVGRGEVVESFVWPEGAADWQPPGTGVLVKSGDWLLGVVWDDTAWADILAGRITGVSPQGKAARRTPAARAKAGSPA